MDLKYLKLSLCTGETSCDSSCFFYSELQWISLNNNQLMHSQFNIY